MHALKLFGRGLIGLALLSLLGEIVARLFLRASGYLSAGDIWVIFGSESYVAMRAWFRETSLALWSYGFGPILAAPAWLLFGAPGVAAVWFAEGADGAAEAAAVAESALLYDELEKQAKAEGYAGDAGSPSDVDDILASAREAEADLARDLVRAPGAEPESKDSAAPPNRPPS